MQATTRVMIQHTTYNIPAGVSIALAKLLATCTVENLAADSSKCIEAMRYLVEMQRDYMNGKSDSHIQSWVEGDLEPMNILGAHAGGSVVHDHVLVEPGLFVNVGMGVGYYFSTTGQRIPMSTTQAYAAAQSEGVRFTVQHACCAHVDESFNQGVLINGPAERQVAAA